MSENTTDYVYQVKTSKLVNNVTKTYNLKENTKWIQIAIEQSAAYTAGTLDVYFKPVGLDNFQRYYTDGGVALSINMNAPRALVLENFAISGIQLVPANIAGGDTAKTYNISIVSLADQATVYTEVV
mgnify:FL=1